jgi:acetyltransferase-like isoleucine patch superfamily enzyme
MIKKTIWKFLFKNRKYKKLYLKLCNPSGREFAKYLKYHDVFYSIGDNCSIRPWTNIPDPAYLRIGNNVQLSACTLLGHDGSIAMLNIAYNKKLDRVGKIDIGNNVFIGHGAIVLPNVSIGNNVIVGAGSLVTKSIPDGKIVGGVPAKVIGDTESFVDKLEEYTNDLPWVDIIKTRNGSYDPLVESELVALRVKEFYGQAH